MPFQPDPREIEEQRQGFGVIAALLADFAGQLQSSGFSRAEAVAISTAWLREQMRTCARRRRLVAAPEPDPPACLVAQLKARAEAAERKVEELTDKLDEIAPWICDGCNRAWPRESLRSGVKCVLCPDDSCGGFLATPSVREQRLRDENAQLRAALKGTATSECVREMTQKVLALAAALDDTQLAEGLIYIESGYRTEGAE